MSKRGADESTKKKSTDGASSHFNIADATSEGMDEADEAGYFDEVVDAQSTARHGDGGDAMFSELSLSRQLLRGVEAAG